MAELKSVAPLVTPTKRWGQCKDCAAPIEQEGYPGLGLGLWSPVFCSACMVKAEARLREKQAERDREEADRRAYLERRRIAHAVEGLAVPPKYRAVTLEGFRFHGTPADRSIQQDVVRKGFRYIGTWPEPSQDILVLRGEPGTGKGHWVWSVSRAIAGSHGARIRVVKLADLVRRLRASWGREVSETEGDALTLYRDLDLLVIDEVSSHAFYGQNIHQHLYDVIDHRVEYCRPTILTTNETIPGLEAILRHALVDRLMHRGGVLEFGTASYRALDHDSPEGAA